MKDETARLAAHLSRSINREDWWNVYLDHTDYEWAHQVALYSIEPWGERRNDIRAAWIAAHMIAKWCGTEDFESLKNGLRDYLRVHETPEQEITPQAAAVMMGAV